MKQKLTDEQIVELFAQGATVKQVALQAGISPTHVRNAMIRASGLTPFQYQKSKGILPQQLVAEQVVELRKQGLRGREIAERLGVSMNLVRRHASAAGLPHMRRVEAWDQAEDIVRLYEAGESANSIAQRYKRSEITIRRILNDAGVERRPIGRPGRGLHPQLVEIKPGQIWMPKHPSGRFECVVLEVVDGFVLRKGPRATTRLSISKFKAQYRLVDDEA